MRIETGTALAAAIDVRISANGAWTSLGLPTLLLVAAALAVVRYRRWRADGRST